MAITHAVLGEVVCEGLEPVADVGDRIPVHHGSSIISVAECEGLADGVCQLCAVEAIVVSDGMVRVLCNCMYVGICWCGCGCARVCVYVC